MVTLTKYYPKLVSAITNLDSLSEDYQFLHSKNGSPNVTLKKDGQEMTLYSKYSPEQEVTLWIKQLNEDLKDAKHILLTGFGLGYHLETLIDNFPDKIIYVYEPDPNIFTIALHMRKLTRLLSHSNLHIFAVGPGSEIMRHFASEIVTQLTGPIEIVNVPPYEKLYKETINELIQILGDCIKSFRTDIATYSGYSLEWIKNTIYNLKYVKESTSVDFLKNMYPSIPAIIVGSGPSLSYDLDTLRELKNKAIIIAAGTSTQALLAANIEPDIIVIMDGSFNNFKAFQDLDTLEIPIVFAPVIYRGILTEGHRYYAYAPFALDRITLRLVNKQHNIIFTPSYSVTGLCIQLAAFMGCPKIIFTGQDLSFPKNQFYAANINHIDLEAVNATLKEADGEVPNVSGGTNRTNDLMHVTLRNIEELIGYLKSVQFINSSRSGAHIKGTQFLPLKDLQLEKLPLREHNEIKDLFNMTKYRNNTDKDRIEKNFNSDFRNLKQLKSVVSSLNDKFELLGRRTLSLKEQKDKEKELVKLWDKITNHSLFHPYVEYGLNSVLFAKQRSIHGIQKIPDTSNRISMMKQHIGSLNVIIDQYLEELIHIFGETFEENFGENKKIEVASK